MLHAQVILTYECMITLLKVSLFHLFSYEIQQQKLKLKLPGIKILHI